MVDLYNSDLLTKSRYYYPRKVSTISTKKIHKQIQFGMESLNIEVLTIVHKYKEFSEF